MCENEVRGRQDLSLQACTWYLSIIKIFSGDTILRLLDHMEFLFRLNKDVAEINELIASLLTVKVNYIAWL